MWAPVVSRMALILHPPRPITRLITDDETDIFLDLKIKSQSQPTKGINFTTIHSPYFSGFDSNCSSYLLTTSFQPSSCFLPFFGLGKVDIFVVAVVVVRVTARHWAAAVATVMGDKALWGVVWVMMVLATTLVISAVFITLITSLDLTTVEQVTSNLLMENWYLRKWGTKKNVGKISVY